jgi:hypothetical protein
VVGFRNEMVVGSLALLFTTTAMAFKPAPLTTPIVYSDTQKSVELKLTPKDGYGPATVTVTLPGHAPVQWKQQVEIPTTALVSSTQGRIVLLGGYGEPGDALGRIEIFDMAGTRVKSLNLSDHVTDLPSMSQAYREVCCPSPWVHGSSWTEMDAELHVNVCDKTTVAIDMKSGDVVQ